MRSSCRVVVVFSLFVSLGFGETRIDTDQAHAVITAVVKDDGTRGVQIDLSNKDSKEQVFLKEESLDRTIKGLDDIAFTAPLVLPRLAGRTGNFCFGSGEFSKSDLSFTASQCVFGDWSGLSVNGRFKFTGIDATPFASKLALAREELKALRK